MFANVQASSSSSSLPLDDLGWLAASALIDLPTLPSPRSSVVYAESSSRRDSQLTAGSSTSSFQSALEEQQAFRYSTDPVETASPSPTALTPATPVKLARFSPSTPHLPSPPLTPPHCATPTSSPARTEWIYRQPRTPPRSSSSPSRPSSRPRPQTGYHSPPPPSRPSSMRNPSSVSSSKRVHRSRSHRSPTSNTVPPPFWSTILRPRSRSERSIPSLKSIPSQSQIDFTPAPSTTLSAALTPSATSSSLSSASDPFKADSIEIRPSSVASTLSSTSLSTATSSSRPETPTSPSFVSSPYRPRYQRRRATDPSYGRSLPPVSASCPPSKSILTRASSISTKNSSSTAASKSVKFVDMPTVHYASAGYWDLHTSSNAYLERTDETDLNMGVDVDNMDVDMDSQLSATPDECEREQQCSTPTPEKERAKGLLRLVTMSKRISSVSSSSRPTISGPYALGTLPSTPPPSLPSASRSAASLWSQSSKHSKGASDGSVTGIPLRTAPSLESFRSVKSSAGRSVRSLGSVKSDAGTRGFRAWLSRLVAGRKST